jgi:hypothetical protein
MLQEFLVSMACGTQVAGGPPCLNLEASNLLTVGAAGTGAQYTTVGAAVDSIRDAAEENPYVVVLLPGSYVEPSVILVDQPYVSIVGAGAQATVIRRTGNGDVIKINASNVTIADLKVIATTTDESQGAIRHGSGRATEIVLQNLWVQQVGPGSLVATPNINPADTWVLRDIIGISNASGIRGKHTMLMSDSRIILYGNVADGTAGHAHIGLWKTGGTGRWWIWDTQVGPKLMWNAVGDDGTVGQYTVDGDDDVIALRDASADGSRLSLRNVDLFARNETATEHTATVLAVQTTTPTAIIRMWGGYAQTEQPNSSENPATLDLAKGSTFERFANPRLETAEGDTFGGPNWGVKNWTVEDDNTALEKWQSAVHRCDASAGPFTLKLPHLRLNGEKHTFVKVDASDNQVVIALNGATLEGSSTNPTLKKRYDKLIVQWDGVEWLRVGD